MSARVSFEHKAGRDLDPVKDINEAIQASVIDYMHHQLGWSLDACRQRALEEAQRTRQKGILKSLEHLGWGWAERRVLDLGAGQGGLLMELLERGADAFGIEPNHEFANLARLRLSDAQYSPNRVSRAHGERLPFRDSCFDCTLTLQVLEHVPNPKLLLQEIYRVLKPGGHCYISTENYWSFYEPHYRLPWFPLLPKRIGSWYLRGLGRDPDYLNQSIFYTSYLQTWFLCRQVGFNNVTYHHFWDKVKDPATIARRQVRLGAELLRLLPSESAKSIVYGTKHLANLFRPGVHVLLTRPV